MNSIDNEKFDGAGALVCESLNFAGDTVLTYVARVPFRNISHFAKVRWWEENGGSPSEPAYLFCAHNFQIPPTNWMSWEVQPGYMQFFSTPYEALANTIPWFPIYSWGEDELNIVDADLFDGARKLRDERAAKEKAIRDADKKRDRLAAESEANKLKWMAGEWAGSAKNHTLAKAREDIEINLINNRDGGYTPFVVKAFRIADSPLVVHERPSDDEVVSGKFNTRKRAGRKWVLTHVPSGLAINPAEHPDYLEKNHAHSVGAALVELGADWADKRPDKSMSAGDKEAAKFILKTVSELYARGITDWENL